MPEREPIIATDPAQAAALAMRRITGVKPGDKGLTMDTPEQEAEFQRRLKAEQERARRTRSGN